jgi:pimeloyl-ACP methyl ester carboxylesterase
MNTSIVSNDTLAKPQLRRRGHGFIIWMGRVLLGLLALLIGLAGIGATYQTIATANDRRIYPPPGQLVDVGGYKLHIDCVGEGSPTVILDHVGAASSAQWGLVQPEIAKTTRVCAYDRAGFGWSDPGPAPRDARQNMQELHTLLTNAHIAPPYVLVGHSYGGNVARLYVADYRDQIAGMVLVDPGNLFDTPSVPPEINAEWKAADQTIMRLGPILSRLGVMRLAAVAGLVPGHGDLPTPVGAAYDAVNLRTTFWDTLGAQNQAMPVTSAEVLGASHTYGALPLIVLSVDQPTNRSRQIWIEVNAELATYSTIGIHRVVAEAEHMALALDRQHAQATIAAIRQVLAAVAPVTAPASAPTNAPTTAPTVVPTAAPTQAPTATATDPCAAVEHLDPASRAAHAIGSALVRSLPPDRDVGQIDRIYGVDRLGAWVVLEASFTQIEPGVFVLRQEPTGYREIASWGGPVDHANQVQEYLRAQAPGAPTALLTCLRPKQAHFTYHQL